MNNIIICVASKSNARFQGFLDNLKKCYFKGPHLVIAIGTGEPLTINPFDEGHTRINPLIIQLEDRKRWYGEIIYEKCEVLKSYANEDSVIIMCDDDYSFNLFSVGVARKIFSENSHVDYLSLLKGPGLVYTEDEVEKLSGFDFLKTHSCMGGSTIVRWKTFLPMVEEFFETHGQINMFDSLYWQFLDEKENDNKHVYTILNFSLMQHTNLISHYLDQKGPGGVRSHMYGESYDDRCNPFSVLGISEVKEWNCGYDVSTYGENNE